MIGRFRLISNQTRRGRLLSQWDNMDARQLEDLGLTRADLARQLGRRF
jgi:uncharacterized protein YjiS (DUF1127 family)